MNLGCETTRTDPFTTGTQDDGPGKMNNVNENENPIRVELGDPKRTKY
jgi:hypothetical protein